MKWLLCKECVHRLWGFPPLSKAVAAGCTHGGWGSSAEHSPTGWDVPVGALGQVGFSLPWWWQCCETPVQAQPHESQHRAGHGTHSLCWKGPQLPLCLGDSWMSGKGTLALSTEHKHFTAGINLPLLSLALLAGHTAEINYHGAQTQWQRDTWNLISLILEALMVSKV